MSPEKTKLARLLRSQVYIIDGLIEKMDAVTGKRGVVELIVNDNRACVQNAMQQLGLAKDAGAEAVYEKLQMRILETDRALSKFLGEPDIATEEGSLAIAHAAGGLANPPLGFYLKREKARELLEKNEPRHLLRLLKYENVQEAIEKEGLFAVFSSVRFAEPKEWLHDVFFKEYERLTRKDFEERTPEVIVLPERWREIGERFVGKKLHHISHLKELGVIFVIPVSPESAGALPEFGEGYNVSGGTLEVFTLVLHYFFEVPFYAEIFASYADDDATFNKKFVSALRGDVLGVAPPLSRSLQWRVIQRYLAKDNLSDPRLSEPHVNPEALHWAKAEKRLAEFDAAHPGFGFSLWGGLDFAGDFFPMEKDASEEVLLSFDLIDNMISLRRRSTVISKYLYHQQEALWNRIFTTYVGGEGKMEEMIKENLYQGYIEF